MSQRFYKRYGKNMGPCKHCKDGVVKSVGEGIKAKSTIGLIGVCVQCGAGVYDKPKRRVT